MKTTRHRHLLLALCLLAYAALKLALAASPRFDAAGYQLPTVEDTLAFPRDHASHPAFKTEWWYITGHLQSPSKPQGYGFQITFFRSATVPPGTQPAGAQPPQIFMAHAAVIDKASGKFLHEERFNRQGWNAHASTESLDLANGNWSLQMLDTQTEEMQTSFSVQSDYRHTLSLRPAKPKTLFGPNGVSRKGEDPTAKSYYITFTRLEVSGSLRIGSETLPVNGLAWMDHEISSSQLSPGQIGWNWTSLILDDGTELMAYVMRRDDGQTDPFSTLNLIDATGKLRSLKADSFSWIPIEYWKSEATQASYPIRYRIEWTEPDGSIRSVTIKPIHPKQEIVGSIGGFSYWEGAGIACDATGQKIGLSYTELTGYNQSLYGKF